MHKIPNRREIINRAKLMASLDAALKGRSPETFECRSEILSLLKSALADGRAVVERRFMASNKGRPSMYAGCFVVDQIVRTLFDLTTGTIYPRANPTKEEKISVVAVGGYGRGELAPFSDIDLLFLFPYKQTPWCEQVVEYMLYMLWDLGLKVGYSTRNVDECIRMAKTDVTIKTALLESRYLWGDQDMANELRGRYLKEVVAGNGKEFIEAKLQERGQRHERYGNSRYVVEPNMKEGKGGLRDIQTLFWIAKFLYSTDDVSELVVRGVFSETERRRITKASNFLRTVRCHLHYLTGRPEERLTFDVQSELARRLGYKEHAGSSGVERFMKHYFLVAKDIGDLTRIFCASLEAEQQKTSRFRLPRFGLRQRQLKGFIVDGGRVNIAKDTDFQDDPLKFLLLFHLAQQQELDIHPNALRIIRRDLRLVNKSLRNNAEANKLFIEILTSPLDPEDALRKLNEAGVLGRFIPDFGRVVAQMQHDMYHVYTVDEHTIRAIGILSKIEAGHLREEHPLSHKIMPKVLSRRVLYVAVLLHDIAKGRGGDHSELGAGVAKKLCPRFGFSAAETETVSWLVRHHLAFSNFAFKRDISDPKTVADFTGLIQSPERLRLLLILTVVDIRAVGPNVWNGWKGQLLRELYYASEGTLTGGHLSEGRETRAKMYRQALAKELTDWKKKEIEHHLERFYQSYWLSTDTDTQIFHARFMKEAADSGEPLAIKHKSDPFLAITEVTLFAPDHPGLFARVTSAMSVSGANIVDAKIHTTTDGMALDTFFIQDDEGGVYDHRDRMARLIETIRQTLEGSRRPHLELIERQKKALPSRTRVFKVAPLVLIDNGASNTHSVIEVNGRDRSGLLARITRALFDLSLTISSAHIATFGERAVDVFYVKNMFGLKITSKVKLKNIEEKLMTALAEEKIPSKKQTSANKIAATR